MREDILRPKAPAVSIIMPAYNSALTIGDSIRSVLNQTYSSWELLVIDDASSDNVGDMVTTFHDDRIRYDRLPVNSGVAAARNQGIQEAEGRYLAFLDSDDMWHPDKLAHQLAFMKKNRYAFTYTWYQQFNGSLEHLKNVVKTKPYVDYSGELKGNDIGCLTVMLDRKRIGRIEMPSQRHEDYITWLTILKQGYKAYALPEVLAYYRIGKKSLTGSKWKSMQWTWKVYRASQHLSLPLALYYMVYYIGSGIRKHYL